MVASTKKKPVAAPASTGAIIDQLWAAREEKRLLAAQDKEVSEKIKAIEQQLMERLETEGMTKATGGKATASITTSVVADVQDWDEFWAFVIKKKFTQMLQRRVSEPAYRELLEKGIKVPGVQPFTKKSIGLRSLSNS